MAAQPMQLPEVLVKASGLMLALGFRNICNLTGCAEHQIDENWWIAVNGHREPTKCSKGATVPPFSVFVFWNDFPAGVVDAGGGAIIGTGDGEEKLIAAIDEATRRAEAAA
jgi:hypothetical protein